MEHVHLLQNLLHNLFLISQFHFHHSMGLFNVHEVIKILHQKFL